MVENVQNEWIKRMKTFLFIHSPKETDDHVKAAIEVVDFIHSVGAWSDFPFDNEYLPDMNKTVTELGLSLSWVDYYGWFDGSIQDIIELKQKSTRCERCRQHVNKFWNGNVEFEREVARLLIQYHNGNLDVAEFSVNPEMVPQDCVLNFFEWDVAYRISEYIRNTNTSL